MGVWLAICETTPIISSKTITRVQKTILQILDFILSIMSHSPESRLQASIHAKYSGERQRLN